MPPRARTKKPDGAEERPEPRHAKADADICRQCWPEGWRETTTYAVCEHGAWSR